MRVPERIANAAKARITAAQPEIDRAADDIEAGRPLKAEPVRARAVERVAVVANVDRATASQIVDDVPPAQLGLTGNSLRRAEAIQGKTVEYMGVAWLEAGALASRAVARIAYANGQPLGTGFLVSDRLLLTNNHVIPSREITGRLVVEFLYEVGLRQTQISPVRFALDPAQFFATDEEDDLDFTLIALGPPQSGSTNLKDFGCCPLSASSAKHSVGEPVNIVQHPDGDVKQVVVRDNRIIHRDGHVLHYIADTEPGASGSPVFNDDWHVVALHHWGEPHRSRTVGGRRLRTDVNEGIRISAIVEELKRRDSQYNSNQRQLLAEALRAPSPSDFGTRQVQIEGIGMLQGSGTTRYADDFVSSDLASGEAREGAPANRIDRHYDRRKGYNERFLRNFPVPMPQLNAAQRQVAARVRGVGQSANPYELKYQHFSVVVNAARRMAFYSICNMDGSKRIVVDRDTGRAIRGPEATETWAVDPRIPEDAQLSDAFYARMRRDLRTPGDFFARGHLTRREDPNWGRDDYAERANNDTFHHPNGCPQVNNAFNSSQKAWQGIENYILDSGDDSNLRVTVITGPIFDDDSDPIYEDEEFGAVQLPSAFWKVVVRVEDGTPIVFAVLADQSESMAALVRGRREGLWDWPTRLSREFISTVSEIAERTGLDFGNLSQHDIFAGSESAPLRSTKALFPARSLRGNAGFGKFQSIGEFLEQWETRSRDPRPAEQEPVPAAEEEGRERRRRRPRRPAQRPRKVVEVEAVVKRVFSDDLAGAMHQQFTIVPRKWISGDAGRVDVEATIAGDLEVRVAVRFGDSRGLEDRIPGIHASVVLHLKGEWISAQDAYDVGGEDIAVLHFTHDPLGWVCTPADCYS